jgi:RNA polymerase sigma-70 factor (ECF subfamily)
MAIVPVAAHVESELVAMTDGLRLIALRALGNSTDAEDAAQETLTRAVQAVQAGRVPRDVPLARFVHGIAKHVVADVARRRGRVQELPGVELITDSAPNALDALVRADERVRVRAAIARLSSEDRDILRHCYGAGTRIVDLARELNEPPERLRQRKSRALQRLRTLLGASVTNASPER